MRVVKWFGLILKETRQIASTGFRTKLGTTPLTMGDENDDDRDCCSEALADFHNLMDDIETFDWLNAQKNSGESWRDSKGGFHSGHLYSYTLDALHQIGLLNQGIREQEKWCNEVKDLMERSYDYYYNIVRIDETNSWVSAEAYHITRDIDAILERWEDCENEMV